MESGLLTSAFSSIEKIKLGLENQAQIILVENAKGAKNLLLENQLFLGIDGKGDKLKPYTQYTIEMKKALGQPHDRTTLKDTGDFYKDTYLYMKPNTYFGFDSSNEKTPKLKKKYGDAILHLTPENEYFLNIEIVLPLLEQWILKNLKI